MGAYRNGKMLPHDDDFDLVIHPTHLRDSHPVEDKVRYLEHLCKLFQEGLKQLGKDSSVGVRVVQTYAKKLEVFMPKYGKYPFRDGDYHNVCCDLTLLLKCENEDGDEARDEARDEAGDEARDEARDETKGEAGDGMLLRYQHLHVPDRKIKMKHLLPLSQIYYEGYVYQAPCSVAGYLSDRYGYIGKNAVYDHNLKIYVKSGKD